MFHGSFEHLSEEIRKYIEAHKEEIVCKDECLNVVATFQDRAIINGASSGVIELTYHFEGEIFKVDSFYVVGHNIPITKDILVQDARTVLEKDSIIPETLRPLVKGIFVKLNKDSCLSEKDLIIRARELFAMDSPWKRWYFSNTNHIYASLGSFLGGVDYNRLTEKFSNLFDGKYSETDIAFVNVGYGRLLDRYSTVESNLMKHISHFRRYIAKDRDDEDTSLFEFLSAGVLADVEQIHMVLSKIQGNIKDPVILAELHDIGVHELYMVEIIESFIRNLIVTLRG